MEEETRERAVNLLRRGRSVILWNESVRELRLGRRAIHVRDFKTCKPRLMEVYNKLYESTGLKERKLKRHQLQRLTVLQLVDEIKRAADKRYKVVLAFDHYELVTPTTAETLLELQEHQRILLCTSRFADLKHPEGVVYQLYRRLEPINIDGQSGPAAEHDLTPLVMSMVFLYFLAVFIKAITSQEQYSTTLYGGIVGLFWLVFLISRTFLYVTISGRKRK